MTHNCFMAGLDTGQLSISSELPTSDNMSASFLNYFKGMKNTETGLLRAGRARSAFRAKQNRAIGQQTMTKQRKPMKCCFQQRGKARQGNCALWLSVECIFLCKQDYFPRHANKTCTRCPSGICNRMDQVGALCRNQGLETI